MLATLLAFVTFAASFLARPFGSLLLGGQNDALVMNFGIQTLGWYLGAMAVIALVALVFFRESKDVDFEQSRNATQQNPLKRKSAKAANAEAKPAICEPAKARTCEPRKKKRRFANPQKRPKR